MKRLLTVLLALFLISSPAFATVSDTESPVKIYSGTATTYTIPFGFIDDEDVLVTLVNATTGVETAQTKDVDYTISGTTVTYSVAPGSAYNVVLRRETPFTQEASFSAGEAPPLTTYESAYDKLTYLVQDLDERLGRSILLPQASTVTDIEWPDLTLNAGKLVRINTDGNGLEAISTVSAGSALDVTAYCDAADLTALHGAVSNLPLLNQIATSSGVTNDIMTNLVSISNTGGYSNFSDEYSATSNTATTTLTQLNVSAGDRIFVEASVLVVGASSGDSVSLSISSTFGDSAIIKFVYDLSEITQTSPDGAGASKVHISGIVQVLGSGDLRLKTTASNGVSYSSNQIYAFFLKKL